MKELPNILIIEAHSDDSAISIGGFLEKYKNQYNYHFALATASDVRLNHFGQVTRDQRLEEYQAYIDKHQGTWHRTQNLPLDADTFIVLDDVQFSKSNFQNRTRLSTSNGLKFLTVPVFTKGIVSNNTPINQTRIAKPRESIKHFKSIQQRYGKTLGWKFLGDKIEAILSKQYESIFDLAMETMQLSLETYQVSPKIIRSSDLLSEGKKAELVLSLCKAAQAETYIAGSGALDYMRDSLPQYTDASVEVIFQEFQHPVYHQSIKGDFQPAAFALEWFLEEGPDAVDKFHTMLKNNKPHPARCLLP